ncbi:unnamed protein product [Cylicocyclus nassatus]|uniref:Uncharacterized protein n=1 Tax=Cylicocyclus nassatus TaxID=53992 RepID=A0AA36GWJ5_CYLNA|nr:unnamed protein product [Cylicocyclus nassatus]
MVLWKSILAALLLVFVHAEDYRPYRYPSHAPIWNLVNGAPGNQGHPPAQGQPPAQGHRHHHHRQPPPAPLRGVYGPPPPVPPRGVYGPPPPVPPRGVYRVPGPRPTPPPRPHRRNQIPH